MERKQRRLLMVLAMGLVVGMAASAANAQLIAHWKLDETGGTVAHEETGDYNGVFYGQPSPQWSTDVPALLAGSTGSCNFFPDSMINVGIHPIFDFYRTPCTIALWFKSRGFTNTYNIMIGRTRSGWSNRWYITGRTDGTVRSYGYYGGWQYGVTQVDDMQWHHVVFTFDGVENQALYVDGKLETTRVDDDGWGRVGDVYLAIGGSYLYGDDRPYDGLLDDVSIWGQAMNEDQVKQVMRFGPGGVNLAPQVEAGAGYRCVIEPKSGPIEMELTAIVEDASIFGPNALNFGWSKIMGEDPVTFDPEPNVTDVTVTFPDRGRYMLKLRADDGLYETNDTIVVDVKPWHYTGLATHYEFEDNLLDTAKHSTQGGSSFVYDNLTNKGDYRTIFGSSGAPSLGRATYIGKNGDLEQYNWLETADSVDLDMENLGIIAGLEFGAPFTLECYVKPDIPEVTNQYWAPLISKWNADTSEPEAQRTYCMALYYGELDLEIRDINDSDPDPGYDGYYGGETSLSGDYGNWPGPRQYEWQHVAIVGNADGSFDFWIDGVLRTSANIYSASRGKFIDTTAPLRIGEAEWDPGESYRGWIDDVKIWRFNRQEAYLKERAQLLTVQAPYPKHKNHYAATDVVLNWSPAKGYDNPTYTVYLDTVSPPVAQVATGISDNFYDPGGLLGGTDYYWQVDIDGGTTGDLWHFKTVANTEGHLLAHWKFDEGTGTVAHDGAGTGDDTGYYRYPGVGLNLPPQWVPGWIAANPATGIRIRTYEYLDIETVNEDDPNIYTFLTMDDFSLTTWARTMPTFKNVWSYFIAKGENSYRFGRFYDTNVLRFYAQGAVNYGPGSSTGSMVGFTPVGDGYWHHAACVYKAPTRLPGGGGQTEPGVGGSAYLALYIDGELDVSGPVTGNFGINQDSRVQIGGNQAWPTREFTGALDDMRVYRNHALTAAEVKALFDEGVIDDPPVTNAGTNTVVQPPGPPYTLLGLESFISDDGEPTNRPPLDGSPQLTWAQISGPGTVTFDPCVVDYGTLSGWAANEVTPVTTNMTFSAPGFYNVCLITNDYIYKHVDDVRIWVQEVAGDMTIAYWRYETNDTNEDYRGVPGADDPNTLVIPNEVAGAPPLIATRNSEDLLPALHTPAWSKYPTIPGYGDAANDSYLGEGPGRLFSWGERIGTTGMSITSYAEAWDGILFPEDGITVEGMVGLDEQNWTLFDMETGRAGLRVFNASTGTWNNWSGIGEWDGVYVPVNTLKFEFWLETEIINEYAYNCLISDILIYEMGWMHIAFTYDKTTGIARVYKDGIPAWLTHWFNPERQSETTTNPKGFTEYNPIVECYQGVPGRTFSLPAEFDVSVSTDVDTIPSYFDELRISAEALFPPKFLIKGPKMCAFKIEGDMDGDCDVDIYDLYLFGKTWLECNNADLTQCFK